MEKLLFVFSLLVYCAQPTHADLIQACITWSAPAGADGLIMSAAASQTGSGPSCQLNLTDIPSNSWIQFREEADGDCEPALNLIHGCSSVSCQNEKTIICVLDEMTSSAGNTVQLDIPRMFAQQDGHPRVLMSYRVALVLPLGNGVRRDVDVTDDHGYLVSHAKYLIEEEATRRVASTIRMNFRPKEYPFVVSLAFLGRKLDTHCGQDFIQINSDRICDIDKASSNYIVMSQDMTSVTILLAAERLKKGHGFLLQYKVVKLAPQVEPIEPTQAATAPTTSLEKGQIITSPGTTIRFIATTESLSSLNTGPELSITESKTVTENKEALTDKSTIRSLTAICVVLGLLLIIVIIVFSLLLIRAYRLRLNTCLEKPEYGSEGGAHNAAYAFTVDGGLNGYKEDTLQEDNYCYVDDKPNKEISECSYTVPTAINEEAHVYAKTGEQGVITEDFYHIVEDTAETDNEYHLADNTSNPVYHALESSALSVSNQSADTLHPPSHYSLADHPDQQETTMREDEANGYVDVSKLAVEHVRRSACSLEVDQSSGQSEESRPAVKLISNSLYTSNKTQK